jgi:transposase
MPRAKRKEEEPLVVYEKPEASSIPLRPVRTGPGRPDKLTPEIQERIVKLIRDGNYIQVAARAVGLPEATLYRWLQRGEDERKGKYWDFYEALKGAEAIAEAEAIGEVRTASRDKGQWAAGMTWLERKFPSRWGRRDSTEHSGEIKIRVIDEGNE